MGPLQNELVIGNWVVTSGVQIGRISHFCSSIISYSLIQFLPVASFHVERTNNFYIHLKYCFHPASVTCPTLKQTLLFLTMVKVYLTLTFNPRAYYGLVLRLRMTEIAVLTSRCLRQDVKKDYM